MSNTVFTRKAEACETFESCQEPEESKSVCFKCGHEREAHRPYSERQAIAQLESICEMVERLTKEGALKQHARGLSDEEAIKVLTLWDENKMSYDGDDARERVEELIDDGTIEDFDGFEWDEDEAREAIQEDALEIQVRSDWYTPGSDIPKPSEFYILLCTGGPAVRIIGELDEHGQPDRARIEHQDWGTPWTQYYIMDEAKREALLTYCQQFCFEC